MSVRYPIRMQTVAAGPRLETGQVRTKTEIRGMGLAQATGSILRPAGLEAGRLGRPVLRVELYI
jgi:hypothetical protein